jgi:hypothetical protein
MKKNNIYVGYVLYSLHNYLENLFSLGKHVAFLPRFLCHLNYRVHCWAVFRNMVFHEIFLFFVKELGLLANPSHLIRVLDAPESYMYIVLKKMYNNE